MRAPKRSWWPATPVQQWMAFATLFLAVIAGRLIHPSALAWIAVTASILYFWSAHAMRFSITNLRTILVLVAGFSVALFAFQDYLPFSQLQATSGGFMNLELNPGSVAELYSSHEKALELYFDHFPNPEERYFKTGFYKDTLNGFVYEKNTGHTLDASRMPKTAFWVHETFTGLSISEIATQVQSIWKKEFRYSLTPGQIQDSHPLDTFLFSRKIGFCEHYAAALTSIFKLSHWEAHVAVGFSQGSFNPLLQKLTYEMADAHAWVEVYDAKAKHWVRFDPTLWVEPERNPHRANGLLKSVVLLAFALFFLVFLWIFFRTKANPIRIFLNRIAKLEKKKGLQGTGLTIGERIARLQTIYPKQSHALTEAFIAYQDNYFASEPTPEKTKRFLRAIRRKT